LENPDFLQLALIAFIQAATSAMTIPTAHSALSDSASARQQLRALVRQRRQQLSPAEQQQAASALVKQVFSSAQIQQAQHIALYLANDAELDTFELIKALWLLGKQLYLPVLHPFVPGYLLFMRYQRDSLLYPNKFGIPEPLLQCHLLQPVQQLDIIFTPLVAFDTQGNRLGMGGGFYDRTLAQLAPDSACKVIGLAHDCQQVDAVPTAAWDIPLQQIIVPSKHWTFS
jgi:5-formyltetrahydrofolate cyclo-ligase